MAGIPDEERYRQGRFAIAFATGSVMTEVRDVTGGLERLDVIEILRVRTFELCPGFPPSPKSNV
jgi:hypothetical protein